MAATIFEFFGYRADDRSDIAKHAADTEVCPISGETCQKSFNDGVVSGVCAIKPGGFTNEVQILYEYRELHGV